MCIVSLLLALCDVFSFGRFSNRSSTPPLLVQSPPRASTCVNLATANPFTHTHKHKHAGTSTHAQPVLLFSEITVRLCVNHVRFWPSQECKRWAVRRRTVVREVSSVCVYERNNVELGAHAPARVLPLPKLASVFIPPYRTSERCVSHECSKIVLLLP
jgi:hypothetical protein